MRILDASPHAELSLRMVAREAGITAPSVYRHFADANTMMTEIIRECWSQMADCLMTATHEAGPLPPFDVLRVKMGAFVRYAMERPSRYQLLFATSFEPEQPVDSPLRPAFVLVRESMEAIAAGGGKLPTSDPVSSALLTISLVHGRIALAHLAPGRPGNFIPGVEAFVLETLELLFKH